MSSPADVVEGGSLEGGDGHVEHVVHEQEGEFIGLVHQFFCFVFTVCFCIFQSQMHVGTGIHLLLLSRVNLWSRVVTDMLGMWFMNKKVNSLVC